MLSLLLRVKEDLLRSIEDEVQRYQIKRDIISKNIFGVDIDENAIEIARLRLWLSLIEEVEVEDRKQIDTLPNIDFNIMVGNSLIGWLDEPLDVHPLVSLLESDYVKATLDSLEVFYGDTVSEARELLSQLNISSTIEAYKILSSIYSQESGEKAVRIKGILEKVRERLYELISSSYLNFVKEKTKLKKEAIIFLGHNLHKINPFHWKVDFKDIINSGGFDVIVGNPPYIENRNYNKIDLTIIKSKTKKSGQSLFFSKDCGNTHAYFIERSIRLLKEGGQFGFIVPIALVSTDRMESIRKVIHNNSSEVKYFNFDDRPAKIFSGLEDCRATIIITTKGKGIKKVTTSKYHRWYTKDRTKLFKKLKTTFWKIKEPEDNVPKIGEEIEKKILDKLADRTERKSLGDFMKDSGNKIWYHNAPRYWIHAHSENYLPQIEYYDGYEQDEGENKKRLGKLKERKTSSHYKPLIFEKANISVANGLMNSSLFYWWFIMWSNGRDLSMKQIENFPINLYNFPDALKERVKSLIEELMKNYSETSREKVNLRTGGYVIRIIEMIPKMSKDIIDRIDDIFAEYFGFNEQQREYIKNFDLEFRMGS